MKKSLFGFLIILSVLISGCNPSQSATINPEVLGTKTPPPAPVAGKATITGQIMHQDGYPMADTVVRMAEVVHGAQGKGGAYILDIARSPGTMTDPNGQFVIPNIKPGEYVIVVGDIELTGVYQIITENNGQAKVWNFSADKVTDVGVITVSYTMPTPVPTRTAGPYPAPTVNPYP